MSKPKKKNTRYMSGFIAYKTVSCRVSEYEDTVITEYCRRNNISKSLFLTCAAMYCINNNIKTDDLLESSVNETNFDYRELIDNEENI